MTYKRRLLFTISFLLELNVLVNIIIYVCADHVKKNLGQLQKPEPRVKRDGKFIFHRKLHLISFRKIKYIEYQIG